jgi:signal transduction histidine kinase
MNRVPVWLLPAALVLLDLSVWPGIPLLSGEPVSPAAVAAVAAINAGAAIALLWRRSNPVAAAVVVLVVLSAGARGLPENANLAMAFADLIALYSVAVHRARRPALLLAAASLIWQAVLWGVVEGVDLDYAAGLAIVTVVYLLVIGAGRGRARWHADRAAAAARLAEAEERRARAAETERHRLARELHDVTAHHLTSIVVTASAAQRLAVKRPELAAEAVEFAARTGRETLGALRRLVAILQAPAVAPGLADLVDGFRAVGGTITLDAPAEDLPPPTSEAICGIARESLTNTLRYAPGAPVRIQVLRSSGVVELTVDNEDGTAAGAAEALGGGRGLAGMRERATALGGTLTAGPRDGSGWRVHAVLPDPLGAPSPANATRPAQQTPASPGTLTDSSSRIAEPRQQIPMRPDTSRTPIPGPPPASEPGDQLGAQPHPPATPTPAGETGQQADLGRTAGRLVPLWWRRARAGRPGHDRSHPGRRRAADTPGRPVRVWQPRSVTAVDGVLVALALIGPAAALSELLADPGLPGTGQVTLVVLGAAAHAVPLLWRRGRPWAVLGVVAATAWVWPTLIATGLLPTGTGWLLLAGCTADLMAVHAVARYGRRPNLDWLAIPAATASLALAGGTVMARQPPPAVEPHPGYVVLLLVIAALIALLLLIPVPIVWALGYVVRSRRERLRQREDHAVAASTFWAHNTAWAERARVAAGLRAAVLRHTEAMVAAAGAADLDGVLDSARAALDAMRGLLNGLREDGRPDARDPQPTLAAVGALADRWRSGGRTLDVEVRPSAQSLPTDVDVSAYRVVELLLAADTGPATLRVDAGGDPVRISITPAPPDPDGEVGAGLRARAAAVGGDVAPTPTGLEVRLPAGLGEVASSPPR